VLWKDVGIEGGKEKVTSFPEVTKTWHFLLLHLFPVFHALKIVFFMV
jgi:hypothetical protein